MTSIEHLEIDVGIRIHVAALGEGRPLVLLHGYPESWQAWEHLMPRLAGAGFRVFAADMPGFGRSDKPKAVRSYALENLAAWMAALLEQLGEGRPIPLVGHDWGGVVAFATAAHRPASVSRLTVLNAPHPDVMRRVLARSPAQLRRAAHVLLFQVPGLSERLMRRRKTLEYTFRGTSIDPSVFSDALIDTYVAAQHAPGAGRAMLNYYRAALRYHLPLPHIRVPTTVVWGDRDRFLGTVLWEGMERAIDDVRFVRIPAASHWLQHERPEAVSEAIVQSVRVEATSEAVPAPVNAPEVLTQTASIAGRQIAYREVVASSPEAPCVLLLHGIPTSSFLYRKVLGRLRGQVRALAPDLPGFGDSEKRPAADHSLPAMATFVGDFVEALVPSDQKVHLVVHDIGGPAGLIWATRNPHRVASLLVLDTTLFPRLFRPPYAALLGAIPIAGERAIATFADDRWIERALAQELRRSGPSSEDLREYARPYRDPDARACLGATFAGYRRSRDQVRDARRALHRLTMPTAILFGAADPYCVPANAFEFSRRMPHAELRFLHGVGHYVPDEAPDAVTDEIHRLVSRTTAGTELPK